MELLININFYIKGYMQKTLTVLITGTNKGLGKDLVQLFRKHHPDCFIYATSRELPNLALTKWTHLPHPPICKQLEVTKPESIALFAQQLILQLNESKRQIDILINNAGICSPEDDGKRVPPLNYAKLLMQTNVQGPIRITKALLPVLSPKARVVNVSSLLGALKWHSPQVVDFYSNPNISEEDIEEGVRQYVDAVEKEKEGSIGGAGRYWGAYGTSKMLLNAWSRFVLKRQLKEGQQAICVTPGFCQTSMTKDMPPSPFSYSSLSGATRIYQTAVREDAKTEIFYHRGRINDYYHCGEGLPYDDAPLE